MFSETLKLRSKCDGLIIYGDFNFPTKSWSSISSQNSNEANFLTFIEKFDLIQKIDFHTAATGILDLFFVSENIQVTDICKFQNENSFTRMSNHYPIKTKFHIEISCLYQRKYVKESTLSFCNVNYKLLKDLIFDNPFDTYCWSNPNVIVEHWYKWLLDLLSSTIPKRTKHRTSFSPWISQSTSHMIKCLNTARKKHNESHTKVVLLKSKTDQLIEIDKVSYEESMAAKRSTGKLFKYFRAFQKSVLPSIMHYQNENADTDVSKAALFSKFFASVYVESSIFNENGCSNKNQPILENIDFSEQDIFEICKLLNVNKSKGPDDLPPFLFKNAETLSHSIYQIFRKSSQTCIFPACWKKAIISPLHKKDDKSDIENYNTVSLLSVISKILERIIFKRLYEHFEKIFHKAQYGYRKKRSTIVQLLTFLQLVYNGHENGDSIETVFYRL